MRRIQVDMFEVQLGAALLLQFLADDGDPVRVLADAGLKASGYPVDHVHRKLPAAFASFGSDHRRLDLVIATHYDEDHLIGLVPVIADESIEIGEAWLPPVADETRPPPTDDAPAPGDLLVTALAGPDAAARLAEYLQAKHALCQRSAALERAADAVRADRPRAVRPEAALLAAVPRATTPAAAGWRRVFAAHAEDAAVTLGPLLEDPSHAGVVYECQEAPDPGHVPGAAVGAAGGRAGPDVASGGVDGMAQAWRGDPGRASADATALATIRAAAARDAINALALADVVAALVARGIPIVCPSIPDGRPQRYRWHEHHRRFVEDPSDSDDGLRLALLGPSQGLIRRHWNRLPLGAYVAGAREARIPILSITPSNQLSLVTRFAMDGQGILVTGDSGFVDFAAEQGRYHPQLLAALLPLQVVQVAHHAGNNAHFYRALLAAGYAEQLDGSLLLVSHATRDRHRPSPAFAQFVGACAAGPTRPRVLFTSKPSAAKVRAFRETIHPVVGGSHLVGDVRLVCDDGTWTVLHHAIRA